MCTIEKASQILVLLLLYITLNIAYKSSCLMKIVSKGFKVWNQQTSPSQYSININKLLHSVYT